MRLWCSQPAPSSAIRVGWSRGRVYFSSMPGSIPLDPFAGSGSTLIACQLLGRRGFAMEIDPTYCDVALRRFEQVTGIEPSIVE
jgi:DNA modification methylase